jgi:tetratricopeptide (TPR) repeat protein
LGWIYWTSGRYPEALTHASRAVELARAAGDEKVLAVALHRLLGTPGYDGDWAAGWRDLLALAERTEQTGMVVSAHNNIGLTYGGAGQFALGLPHMEQAVAAAEQRQDPRHLAWQLHNFARFLFDSGDWARARDIYARGASIMREADRHGTTWQSVTMTGFPGALALAEGREDEGRRLLEETAAKIQKIGNTSFLFSTIRPLAEADLLAGDAERARLRFDPMPPSQQNAQPHLAWAEGVVGKEAHAEARLEALIAGEETLDRVDALRVRGLLAIRQGRWDVASEALDEALASVRAMPWPYGEVKTLWVSGQLEAARGDLAAAHKHLVQALAICDRLGEGLYRKYVERDLRRLAHQAS